MPFIALCPYCQVGRIKAPDSALGLTAKCPQCGADFTLVPSGEPVKAAPKRQVQTAAPAPQAEPAPVWDPPAAPARTRTKRATEDVDTDIVPVAETAPAPPYVQTYTPPDSDDHDDPPAVTMTTVVALFLVAAGLVASQIPYGRFGTVGAAALGLCLGLAACVTAAGGLRLPLLATGLNALLLLVVVILPGWLGIESWRPPRIGDDPKVVRSFGPEGLAPTAPDWVPADRAWQFDDVRVQVTGVNAWQVELAGGAKKNWSKGKFLVVSVKVSNVGVARPLQVPKWDLVAAKPGDPVVRLTTAAGDPIAPATFASGLRPVLKDPPATLLPTEAGERTFLFQLPAAAAKSLHLELPGGDFGSPQPVRFHLNTSHIPSAGKKP